MNVQISGRRNNDYKKIWVEAHGPIPRDDDGRSYEIHHINGDHSDNRLENLEAIPIAEHYKKHYENEDWRACALIGWRMDMEQEKLNELFSLAACKRVKEGTHHMTNSEWQGEVSRKRVKEGTHNFLGGSIQKETMQRRLKDGTLNTLGTVPCRLKDGTVKNIPKEVYRAQEGDPADWEYVYVRSKEAARRK